MHFVPWFLIKAPLGDDFPFESKWPLQLTMWQGPLLPRPLRRLGLRAVVQTGRPNRHSQLQSWISAAGRATLRRGASVFGLYSHRGKERSLMGFSKGCHILTSLNCVMRDTYLCELVFLLPQSLSSCSIVFSSLDREEEWCFLVFKWHHVLSNIWPTLQ